MTQRHFSTSRQSIFLPLIITMGHFSTESHFYTFSIQYGVYFCTMSLMQWVNFKRFEIKESQSFLHSESLLHGVTFLRRHFSMVRYCSIISHFSTERVIFTRFQFNMEVNIEQCQFYMVSKFCTKPCLARTKAYHRENF